VDGFFNTGIGVSKKVEGGSGIFLKIENLTHAIKPPNNKFFPIKNLKFQSKLRFFDTLKIFKKSTFSDKEMNTSSC
jgi:hypothetical protein